MCCSGCNCNCCEWEGTKVALNSSRNRCIASAVADRCRMDHGSCPEAPSAAGAARRYWGQEMECEQNHGKWVLRTDHRGSLNEGFFLRFFRTITQRKPRAATARRERTVKVPATAGLLAQKPFLTAPMLLCAVSVGSSAAVSVSLAVSNVDGVNRLLGAAIRLRDEVGTLVTRNFSEVTTLEDDEDEETVELLLLLLLEERELELELEETDELLLDELLDDEETDEDWDWDEELEGDGAGVAELDVGPGFGPSVPDWRGTRCLWKSR
jgi:hypothetical protein